MAIATPKHSEEHPYGSPVPGTLDALLSQRYYVAVALGYLLGLYLVQAASCLCECVYGVDTYLSGLESLRPSSSISLFCCCCVSTTIMDLAPCHSMDQDPEVILGHHLRVQID